ncbi:MAG TPA: immunoglobulin domain-containing protein, partial [Methylomirabilota bacterium]|nr:immunoglobulin domain-containing protein [Methylomirabilota bacterium]
MRNLSVIRQFWACLLVACSRRAALLAALALLPLTMRGETASREVTAGKTLFEAAQTNTVVVRLIATGEESALGFTLKFNTATFTFVSAALGQDAAGAALNVNTNQAASGLIGIALAKSPSETFTAGSKQIVNLRLAAKPGTQGASNLLEFVDAVIAREVADANALELPATYTPGVLLVNSRPGVSISASQTIEEDSALSLGFTISDAQSKSEDLVLSATSSNPALLPNAALSFSGTGANRTLHGLPATNQFGSAIITLTVSDGSLTTNRAVTLTVTPKNDAPTAANDSVQALEDVATVFAAANLLANDAPGPFNEAAEALSLTAVSSPSLKGGIVLLTNNTIRYFPPTNFFGADSFTYTITDNGLSAGSPDPRTASGVVSVTVDHVNARPVLLPISPMTVAEAASLQLTVVAHDPDGQAVTYSFGSDAPNGAVIDPVSGLLTWTPSEEQGPGVFQFTVKATDSDTNPLTASALIQVAVTEVNRAPETTSLPPLSVAEGTLASLQVPASDPDLPGNQLTYTLLPGVPGAVSPSGLFTWTPGENHGGTTQRIGIVIADDGAPALRVTNEFDIIVAEVNSPHTIAGIQPKSGNELEPLTFPVVVTDADLPASQFTYSLQNAPAGMAINSSGQVTWTPTEAQGPAIYTVSVVVTDDATPPISISSQFQVSVIEVNNAPSVAAADQIAVEGQQLRFSVIGSDADLPANMLSFALLNAPVGMSISPSGEVTWTPGESDGGSSRQVSVKVTDDGVPSLSATSSFSVTVLETNAAPELALASKIVTEQTELAFQISAQDPDVPANTVTLSLQNAPVGMLMNGAGQVRWTPTEAQGPGVYTISVTATDNGSPAKNSSGQFTVTVLERNLPPALAISSQAVVEGSLLAFTPLFGDPDVPENNLTFSLEGAPPGMSVDSSGRVTWTPSEQQAPGNYQVTYVITDDGSPAESIRGPFTVNVAEVNAAPVLPQIAAQIVNEGSTLTVSVQATDPDLPAQKLLYALAPGAPAGLAINSLTGEIVWTPTEAQGPGSYNVTVIATDDSPTVATAQTSFVINVIDINDPPTLLAPALQQVPRGEPLRVSGISVADDSGPNPIYVKLEADSGLLTLATTNGILFLEGTTATGRKVAFQGTVEAVNAALGTLLFTPAAPLSEAPSIVVLVNDLGSTGVGSAHEATALIALQLGGLNTEPQISGPTATIIAPEATLSRFVVAVSDSESPASDLVVTVMPANPALIPPSGIVVEGTGETRTIQFTSSPGVTGATQIRVRVADPLNGSAEVIVPVSVVAIRPLVVVHPPSEVTLLEDTPLQLSPEVSGTPPLTYQWFKDNELLSGATNLALSIPSVITNDAGVYQLRIENGAGAAFTTPTVVNVQATPKIVSSPTGGAFLQGASVLLQVQARGAAPLSYRWFKDGFALTNATSASLLLTNLSESHEGAYQVEVSNPFGLAASEPAVVTVEQPPTIVIAPAPLNVIQGNSASLSVVAQGSPTLRYQWFKDGSALLNATNSILGIASASTNQGGSYSVVIRNAFGAITSAPVALRLVEPVRITQGPVSITRNAGMTAVFTVQVTGAGPFAYQWFRNNAIIPGATNDALAVSGLTQSDAGEYMVRVGNEAGSQNSAPATLTVITPPSVTIIGTNVINAVAGQSVTLRGLASGTEPLVYQWFKGAAPVSGANSRLLPLFNLQASDAGAYTLRATNAAGSASAALELLVHTPVAITQQPIDLLVKQGDRATFSVGVTGSAPISYEWFFNGQSLTNETNATLVINSAQLANDGRYRVRVTNPAGEVQVSREALLTVAVRPVITRQPASQRAFPGSEVVLEVVISGTASRYQWLKDNQEIFGATNATLVLSGVASDHSGSYHVDISNFAGSATSDPAIVTVLTPPNIVVHPTSQDILAGRPHTLAVTVTGTEPLTYQWRKNGADLPGATSRTLTLDNPQNTAASTDSGDYSVLVYNDAGASISEPASIFVVTPVAMTLQPVDTEIMEGNADVLFGFATGTGSITYQWRRNGAELVNETNSTLVLANATSALAGLYDLVARNDLSASTSAVARVTIAERPRLQPLPFESIVAVGSDFTLNAAATGLQPMTYQWALNGVVIPGATNQTFTITNAQPQNSGSYHVTVANRGGAAQSNPALVLVQAPTVTLADRLADALTNDARAAVLRGDNFRASAETGEEHIPGTRARRSVWLTWKAPVSGIAQFTTAGSAFDTTLAVYQGPRGTTASMARVASDED